jgi:SM-20-related protein
MAALSIVNADAVREAALSNQPYDYFLGAGMLKADAVDDLRRDFPAIDKPGYLTVDEVQLKASSRR